MRESENDDRSFLGKGQYGTVFLAYDNQGAPYVIKEIQLQHMKPDEIEKTQLEAHTMNQLDHANIIKFYSSKVVQKMGGVMEISMEFASKGTLFEFIESRKESAIGEDEVIDLFTQLCLAVEYIHNKNILHRDLKPQNILLTDSSCGQLVKLTDFGISTILSTRTKATTILGTPSYLAPELINNKPYNDKCDIWALGCCLFEMMARQRAFDGISFSEIFKNIQTGQTSCTLSSQIYSTYLISLVKSMLVANDKLRPSASKLLLHPLLLKQSLLLAYTAGLPKKIVKKSRTLSVSSVSDVSPQRTYQSDGLIIATWKLWDKENVFYQQMLPRYELPHNIPSDLIILPEYRNGYLYVKFGVGNSYSSTSKVHRFCLSIKTLRNTFGSGSFEAAASPLKLDRMTDVPCNSSLQSALAILADNGTRLDARLCKSLPTKLVVKKVSYSRSHVLILTSGSSHPFTEHSRVYGWGACSSGQLSQGSEVTDSKRIWIAEPTPLKLPQGCGQVETILAASQASAIITTDRRLALCGSNFACRLSSTIGDSTKTTTTGCIDSMIFCSKSSLPGTQVIAVEIGPTWTVAVLSSSGSDIKISIFGKSNDDEVDVGAMTMVGSADSRRDVELPAGSIFSDLVKVDAGNVAVVLIFPNNRPTDMVYLVDCETGALSRLIAPSLKNLTHLKLVRNPAASVVMALGISNLDQDDD